MSVEQFYAEILPSQGHRFFFSSYGEQGDPNFKPRQKAFAPGDESAAHQYALNHSAQGANSYFATGGFLPPPIDPDTKKPKGGRKADRVEWFRCLRVDVDCGADKPYASKREGLSALCEFCNKYGLPLPWIVDSGYGLHAYWPFTRDVPLHQWMVMAQQLATACAASQFNVDATTTLDAARVLRVPDTMNYKRGGAVAVRIVANGTPTDPEALVRYLPAAQPTLGAQLPASMRGMTSELQQNIHTSYKLRGVLQQCPGMMAMVADGGARAQEPLWKAALDLIWKSDETDAVKEKVARAVSVGHAGFSEGAFAKKWDQVKQQDYHPPTCTKLASFGMPECATCPLRGKISSPLTLGYPQPQMIPTPASLVVPLEAQHVPEPSLPPGAQPMVMTSKSGVFRVIDATRVMIDDGFVGNGLQIKQHRIVATRMMKGKDGTVAPALVVLLDYPLLEIERLLDSATQRSITAFVFDRGLDKHVRVEFTNAELTDARAFHSVMLGNGLYVSRKAATEIMELFMPEFLSQLQRARAANKIASRCGWTEDFKGFTLGTAMITATGTEHVRPGAIPEEMLAFHSSGNEAEWRRAFDIVLSGGADRQAVLALAMATPLMAFTGLDGVMLNAYSPESGIGKSTLGDAALSIWGSPDHLRKSARDTANATWRIAGVLGNMPMVIDEFTNVDGRALSEFVYTVTQGREKHRLTSDAKLQAGGAQRWCLATITTANTSVHDKLQAYRQDAVAEAARVFDMRLHPLAIDPEELGALKTELMALRTSYGFLGPQLVRLFLSKPASYWRDLIMGKISKWDKLVAQSASDRFRSATAALVEVGAAIGAAMGFNFDVDAIRGVVEASWRTQLADFEAERRKPIDYVINYISDFGGEFLTVGGANGDALVTNTPRRLRGEVRGKTVDGKFKPATVMIPTAMLREYVRERNGNYKTFLEWMRGQLYTGVVTRIGRLVYLEGQLQQHTTDAVEFSAAILHDGVLLKVVQPTVVAVPSTPAKAAK